MDTSKRRCQHVLAYVYTHVFITFISLPILASWGMSFSIASLISNVLFSPLISLLLLLSSIVFFTELLAIPNTYVIYALEIVAHVIHSFLEVGSKQWLFFLRRPPIGIAVALGIIALVLVWVLRTVPMYRRTLIMSGALVLTIIVFSKLSICAAHTTLTRKGGVLTFTEHSNKTLTITDQGYLSRCKSPKQYVTYTLRSRMAQQCGSTHIATLNLVYPSNQSLRAAQEIIRQCTVNSVRVYTKSSRIPKRLLQEYANLQQRAHACSSNITRMQL